MNSVDIVDEEIKLAAQLSLTEIIIGSIGHGFKIPLTGHILSLNQLSFLLNSINSKKLPTSSLFEISSIAAVLKSFSPAGQKLGPMFSISVQGFLFWITNVVFKRILFGQLIGAILLSLWAFIQPAITYILIFGFQFIAIIENYNQKFSKDFSFVKTSLITAVACIILLKLLVAVVLVFYSYFSGKEIKIFKIENISKWSVQKSLFESGDLTTASTNVNSMKMNPLRSAFKDLLKPIFLFSFILMMLFVWNLESSLSEKIWLTLRPLAIAYLLFYIIRSPSVDRLLMKLAKRSEKFNRIYLKSKKALSFVAKWSTRSPEISSRRQLK